jgi:hypothetical protein
MDLLDDEELATSRYWVNFSWLMHIPGNYAWAVNTVCFK